MKKILLGSFIVSILTLGASFSAHADETAVQLPSVYQTEAAFEFELNTRFEPYGQPRASSYYDDLVDHYEHDQLMRDEIARGMNV